MPFASGLRRASSSHQGRRPSPRPRVLISLAEARRSSSSGPSGIRAAIHGSGYGFIMPPNLARLTIPRLGIRPHHHLLEIGCGHGTAVSAVAECLTTGSILAIDRSGATVTRATRRNATHIARGVARIIQLDLAELSVPAQHFNTIFALNVNLFQTGERSTVELIRRALRRRGRLVLGYERGDADHLALRAEQISANLRAGGLATPTIEWAGPHHLYLTATRA
jgi:precorrin-6B methylase 2